jgi:hypothetical protein
MKKGVYNSDVEHDVSAFIISAVWIEKIIKQRKRHS